MILRNDDEFSRCRMDFRRNPQRPAVVLPNLDRRFFGWQPSATNIKTPTVLGWGFKLLGERLAAKVHLRCAILNTFNRPGIPVTVVLA
ncbi:hypothetical protein [Laribacter hongkongensis]|uniref:hypothetical protein n=1 Tax=Laribacter hongkongensis TaxID=168471 RepID=UPI001EFC36E1|nr:hypothetical protein [Laribacter hongkongensis]